MTEVSNRKILIPGRGAPGARMDLSRSRAPLASTPRAPLALRPAPEFLGASGWAPFQQLAHRYLPTLATLIDNRALPRGSGHPLGFLTFDLGRARIAGRVVSIVLHVWVPRARPWFKLGTTPIHSHNSVFWSVVVAGLYSEQGYTLGDHSFDAFSDGGHLSEIWELWTPDADSRSPHLPSDTGLWVPVRAVKGVVHEFTYPNGVTTIEQTPRLQELIPWPRRTQYEPGTSHSKLGGLDYHATTIPVTQGAATLSVWLPTADIARTVSGVFPETVAGSRYVITKDVMDEVYALLSQANWSRVFQLTDGSSGSGNSWRMYLGGAHRNLAGRAVPSFPNAPAKKARLNRRERDLLALWICWLASPSQSGDGRPTPRTLRRIGLSPSQGEAAREGIFEKLQISDWRVAAKMGARARLVSAEDVCHQVANHWGAAAIMDPARFWLLTELVATGTHPRHLSLALEARGDFKGSDEEILDVYYPRLEDLARLFVPGRGRPSLREMQIFCTEALHLRDPAQEILRRAAQLLFDHPPSQSEVGMLRRFLGMWGRPATGLETLAPTAASRLLPPEIDERSGWLALQAERTHDDAVRMNKEVYGSGTAVEDYLDLDYHRLRIQLSVTRGFELWASRRQVKRPVSPDCLDLGAGSGKVSELMTELGGNVTAADLEWEALQLHSAEGNHRSAQQVKVDFGRPLPFKDGSFDIIYLGEAAEHFMDPVELFKEIRRVLRKDGLLILTSANLVALQDRIRVMKGLAPRQTDPNHPYLKLHVSPFAPDTLAASLSNADMTVIELRSHCVYWSDGEDELLMSTQLAEEDPTLGGSLIAFAIPKAENEVLASA